jgi:hypothetical protein
MEAEITGKMLFVSQCNLCHTCATLGNIHSSMFALKVVNHMFVDYSEITHFTLYYDSNKAVDPRFTAL